MGRRAVHAVVFMSAALVFAGAAAARPADPLRVRYVQHSLARTFEWPASGVITNPFSRWHRGIDIGMLRSLTVRAAYSGRVEVVGYATGYEGYGNVVVIDVAPGTETIYAHLSSYRVHPGERIRRGETLGVAGCTGICTGTHLHFEVREHGVAVQPLYFLP